MPETSNTQQQDQGLRSRIIEAARDLFFDHGYSKVTTNEIADALGISKKTLYKEFENKEEILRACVLPRLKESAKTIDSLLADKVMPYTDKLKTIMSIVVFQQHRASPLFMRDVSVNAPDLWREIQTYKQTRFRKFGELLDEGIEHGIFRSDIPREIILRMYTSAAESLMTPQSLGELPCTSQEVFQGLVTILFEGILRDEVRKEFAPTRGISKIKATRSDTPTRNIRIPVRPLRKK